MTVIDFINRPIVVALFMAMVAILVPFMTFHLNKKSNGEDTMRKILDSKVNVIDCRSFKTRIGKESDQHSLGLHGVRADITEIKEGIAYLRGKAGQ